MPERIQHCHQALFIEHRHHRRQHRLDDTKSSRRFCDALIDPTTDIGPRVWLGNLIQHFRDQQPNTINTNTLIHLQASKGRTHTHTYTKPNGLRPNAVWHMEASWEKESDNAIKWDRRLLHISLNFSHRTTDQQRQQQYRRKKSTENPSSSSTSIQFLSIFLYTPIRYYLNMLSALCFCVSWHPYIWETTARPYNIHTPEIGIYTLCSQ